MHSNKHNWTRSSKSVSWIHKKPHVFNTTSWRCPPWQSRHCCHIPGTLAMTRRTVSCVTFAISWRIAFFFRAVNVFMGDIWKLKFLLTPSLTLTALKMQFARRLRMLRRTLLHHVMAIVPGRWQQCLDCHGGHLQDVVLKTCGFLWIQDTDLLDRVQLCLLLCTINVLSYFQNG